MQTIIFYEDLDPSQMVVTAFDAGKMMWRETVLKQSLEAWLKEAVKSARLKKEATLFAVLPETVVGRQLLHLPRQSRVSERRAMAENALMLTFNERAALLHTVPCGEQSAGQEIWAVSGVSSAVYHTWQDMFGRFAVRVKWLSAIECILTFLEEPLEDGLYSLEAPLWTAVFAIKNGVVIDGGATEDRDFTTLQMTLIEEIKGVDIRLSCTVLPLPSGGSLHEGQMAERIFKKTRHAHSKAGNHDRLFWALFLGCVVVPGVLWLGLQARPTPVDPTTEEGAAINTTVTKSHYSTLIEGAYQAKSARITILSQEASEDALAIHGRCNEVLDLADYMRHLDESTTSLHPLLLDFAKKTEKDRYYYEFVVEISLEGRETP